MNTKAMLAAALIAATGSTFAQGTTEYTDFSNFVSTRTRAEVQAELAPADARGQIAREPEYVEFIRIAAAPTSTLTTPAAPRAFARLANQTAYDQALLSRAPEFVEFVNVGSGKSRAQVREEMQQAAGKSSLVIGG